MTTQTKTIQTLAKEIYDNLTTSTRTDGTNYTHLKEDNELHREVMFGAHGGLAPNDYVYSICQEALELFAGCEDVDDMRDKVYYIEAPVYTAMLKDWLASNNMFDYYVDEALKNQPRTLYEILTTAYCEFVYEVCNDLIESLEKAV